MAEKMNTVNQIENNYSPYTAVVQSSDNFIDNNVYVYVVISKSHPLSDISIFSDDKNIADVLMNIDEIKYKIMRLPLIIQGG